ncbi:LexA repressor [Ralstonia syzygii subsp. syzygii]|nr:LexA repressor [Ralstonia syzygii subsp. syzygii]
MTYISLMEQLRRNLAYLLAKHEMTPTALAKATGVLQPTIHRILKGKNTRPRTDTLQPLADYFGVTLDFLVNTDAESFYQDGEGQQVEPAPSLRRFKNVPIVGNVEGGPDGYLEELGLPVGHGDGAIEYPAKDCNTYALRVRGESMRPRIKSGEFIVVEPNTEPHPGDDVVVICHDGRKMVKELLYTRDGEVTLGSINNGYKPISLPLADIQAIHYVAAIVPRGAFYKPS